MDGLVLDKPGAENTDTSVRLSTSWPSLLFFFFLPPHCIGNYAAMGTLGVSRGPPLLFLWMIALLFLFMWDLDAQAAVETKPFYIWQTGMPLVILCKVGVFWRCWEVFSESNALILSQSHRSASMHMFKRTAKKICRTYVWFLFYCSLLLVYWSYLQINTTIFKRKVSFLCYFSCKDACSEG